MTLPGLTDVAVQYLYFRLGINTLEDLRYPGPFAFTCGRSLGSSSWKTNCSQAITILKAGVRLRLRARRFLLSTLNLNLNAGLPLNRPQILEYLPGLQQFDRLLQLRIVFDRTFAQRLIQRSIALWSLIVRLCRSEALFRLDRLQLGSFSFSLSLSLSLSFSRP